MKVYTAIRDRVKERRKRFDTKEVREFPSIPGLSYLPGAFSRVYPAGALRFVKTRGTLIIDDMRESPVTLSRDYLFAKGYHSKPLRGARDDIARVINAQPALPFAAIPTRFDDGFLVDVSRAYFSIMLLAGWDCAYQPGKFFLAGMPPDGFPFADNSIARDCLASCALPHDIVRVDPDKAKPIYLRVANPLLNSSINAVIRQTLHSIAHLAMKGGAVYSATDGFICPSYNIARDVGQIVLDFGLNFKIKAQGAGEIKCLGAYKIGERQTKVFDRSKPGETVCGIWDSPDWRFVQSRLSMFAGTFRKNTRGVQRVSVNGFWDSL